MILGVSRGDIVAALWTLTPDLKNVHHFRNVNL